METLDPHEVDQLLAEVGVEPKFDAPNFADALSGSAWNLPDTANGWRRAAQNWGEKNGLLEPITAVEGGPRYIGFTPRGLAFIDELKKRGLTLVSRRATQCLDSQAI